MLSDFQRKNPNRSISNVNHQTYLNRALIEGRIDELEVYFKDGTLLKALKKSSMIHVQLASGYIRRLTQQLPVELWIEIWNTLQKSVPLTEEILTHCLGQIRWDTNRFLLLPTINAWLEQGANPLRNFRGNGENALLKWWSPILNAYDHNQPDQKIKDETLFWSQKWLEDAQKNKHWFNHPDTHEFLYHLMWRICTNKNNLSPESWQHLRHWQQLALEQGANPLNTLNAHHSSAFQFVLKNVSISNKEKIEFLKELLSGSFVQNSKALSVYDFARLIQISSDDPGILLPLLAQKNQYPWEIDSNVFSREKKETCLTSLVHNLQDSSSSTPFPWEKLLGHFAEVAVFTPPPSDWVLKAFEEWLEAQVYFMIHQKNQNIQIDHHFFENLNLQWKYWAKIGDWQTKPLPNMMHMFNSIEMKFHTMSSEVVDCLYEVTKQGFETLFQYPNSVEIVFGKFQKFKYATCFKLWLKIIQDENEIERVKQLLKSEEGKYLKDYLIPAFADLAIRNLVCSKEKKILPSLIDKYLVHYQPNQYFKEQAYSALIKEYKNPSSILAMLNYLHELKLAPIFQDEKKQMWCNWIELGQSFTSYDEDEFYQCTLSFIEQMDIWGFSKEEALILATTMRHGERCIIPLLEKKANPLAVPCPDNLDSLPFQMLKSQQEKAQLENLSLEIQNETSIPSKSKWRI